MKLTFTPLIACFAIGITVSNAQEKRRLDWQKFSHSIGETKIIDPVLFGKFTIFQIDNINKFLYKVEMEGKSIELQTPVPSELQTLFRLTSTELEKSANANKAVEGSEETNKGLARMEELLKKVESKADDEQVAELKPVMQNLVEKCRAYLEVTKRVAQGIFELKQTRNKLVSVAQLDMAHSDILSRLSEVRLPSPTLKTDYFEFQALYSEVEALYKQAQISSKKASLDGQEETKQGQKDIETSSENIEHGYALINDEALLGLYNDVEFLYGELENRNNFVAVAPPVQMDDDFVTYTVRISPSSTRALAAYRNPMEFEFDVPTRGGWKVDFSVGPVVSFGKGAKDARYYLETDETTETQILREGKNRNDISPSIAALMHFYPRTGRNAALGGLFGIGAGFQSISDINLSLFTGLTYVLGKKQKIMLNGGLSYLRVDRLKLNQFQVGSSYGSELVLTDVIEKVFKASPFLSITYNLATRATN
jgi:hypothetical protein